MRDSAQTMYVKSTGGPNMGTPLLEDTYDLRRVLARLLYIASRKPNRERLPNDLEIKVQEFIEGKRKATIGESQYSYEELMNLILSDFDAD